MGSFRKLLWTRRDPDWVRLFKIEKHPWTALLVIPRFNFYAWVKRQSMQYSWNMLRYHVAFYLPKTSGGMVVAEALDFPGAVTQGFDLTDARLMIASAMEDLAQILLEAGKPLPVPNVDAMAIDADLVELGPLSVHVGVSRV